jgi:hypothetical protein
VATWLSPLFDDIQRNQWKINELRHNLQRSMCPQKSIDVTTGRQWSSWTANPASGTGMFSASSSSRSSIFQRRHFTRASGQVMLDPRPESQEVTMPEHPADLNQPEPIRPAAPRRVVPECEYRTSYVEFFQVRLPAGLHDRLCEWATQERKTSTTLFIEILEDAVRRRGG